MPSRRHGLAALSAMLRDEALGADHGDGPPASLRAAYEPLCKCRERIQANTQDGSGSCSTLRADVPDRIDCLSDPAKPSFSLPLGAYNARSEALLARQLLSRPKRSLEQGRTRRSIA